MKKSFRILFLTASLLAIISVSLSAQFISSREIDSTVSRAMKVFDVPGIAVAVVRDNKVILAKGYGLRSLNTMQKVDENTLFGIASNSKAFTTAALGILIDEKKLGWDDKVIDIIPEFRLCNPYVTEEFTVRDLLTHRSGLGLGAGDLMIWPGDNNFTKSDIIHNLRYLKQVSGFRTKWDYDNLLYIVAGEVVARVSGMSWEDFIEKRIMQALNMTQSAASYSRLKDKTNVIDPHAPVNGKLQVIARENNETANAAGGIYSNITDLSKWVIMQMNDGRFGEGLKKQLFSKNVHKDMWSPQTIMNFGDSGNYNTHFASYGLGWFLRDVRGFKEVSHTGGLAGIVTSVTLIPEMKLGIIVLTNQQSGSAFRSITATIEDSFLGLKGIDRIRQYQLIEERYLAEEKSILDAVHADIESRLKNPSSHAPDSLYTGTYSDKWFGDVLISIKNGCLWFDSKRSAGLSGKLLPYRGNTFIVQWTDRSLDADAYLLFSLDNIGKASGIKMQAISPLTDFSYDFQDLDLVRKKNN
jgi:CubicO group peptidase (beta-lactamase class C family)